MPKNRPNSWAWGEPDGNGEDWSSDCSRMVLLMVTTAGLTFCTRSAKPGRAWAAGMADIDRRGVLDVAGRGRLGESRRHLPGGDAGHGGGGQQGRGEGGAAEAGVDLGIMSWSSEVGRSRRSA